MGKNRRLRGFTESIKEIGYQGIRKGDLIIHAMDAFAGAIGVSDSDGKGSPVYSVCQPLQEANSYYYAYVVREMARTRWVFALAKGIRERSTDFRFDTFAAQFVPVPPSEEQAAIVRFLDHADRRIRRYIRAKRQLIVLLNEQKQAVIHQAVTRGLDPKVKLKPSGVEGLGDVPEHWKVLPFKRSVGFQEGPGIMAADFCDYGVPLLRISCLQGDTATLNGCNFLDQEKVIRKWNHFKVQAGDYLLSASASTGAVVHTDETVAGAIPYTGIIRLWQNTPDTYMPYVRLFMGTSCFQHQINAVKSGVGIEHFGPTHLKRMLIVQPPRVEQRQIVKWLERECQPYSCLVASTRQEGLRMAEFRTRLIADVVTGKLDVREAAARLPDELDDAELDSDELLDNETILDDPELDAQPEEVEA